MTTVELEESLNDERLADVLPLIARAWADGSPTDLDIAAICMEIIRNQSIGISCRQALHHWFDQTRPPSPTDLGELRRRLTTPYHPV